MITGFCVQTPDRPDKIYDYCGCMYPEGVLSTTTNILFDHEMIENVCALGYSDEEEKAFKTRLKNARNRIEENGNK